MSFGLSAQFGVCFLNLGTPVHPLRLAGLRAVALAERLSLLPDGRRLYRLKHRWRDGATHAIYEPLELMERLVALVPPPKFNITRYSGVLAPRATLQTHVAPWGEDQDALSHHGCPARVATPT